MRLIKGNLEVFVRIEVHDSFAPVKCVSPSYFRTISVVHPQSIDRKCSARIPSDPPATSLAQWPSERAAPFASCSDGRPSGGVLYPKLAFVLALRSCARRFPNFPRNLAPPNQKFGRKYQPRRFEAYFFVRPPMVQSVLCERKSTFSTNFRANN